MDMYTSIDLVIEKIERQIRNIKLNWKNVSVKVVSELK
mgnify:CR=1 FL=1